MNSIKIYFIYTVISALTSLLCINPLFAEEATFSIYSETQSTTLGWNHINVIHTHGAYANFTYISQASEGNQAVRTSAQYPWGERLEFTLSEDLNPISLLKII